MISFEEFDDYKDLINKEEGIQEILSQDTFYKRKRKKNLKHILTYIEHGIDLKEDYIEGEY